jgi:hypothetical protein
VAPGLAITGQCRTCVPDWMRAVTNKHLAAIALLCLGLGLNFGSAANQSAMKGQQKIHICIEAARQAGLYPGRCLGLIAGPCINSAKEQDGVAGKAKECAARELKIWSGRLDKFLAAIRRADAGIGVMVAKAQKA